MFSCCTGDDNDPDDDSKRRKTSIKKSRKPKHQNSTDYFIDYYRESLSPTNNSTTQDSPTVRNPKLPYIKSSEYYEGVPEFEEELSVARKSKKKTTPAKTRRNPKSSRKSDDSEDDDLITVEFDDDDENEENRTEIDDDEDDQPIPHLSHDGRKVIWYPPYDPPPVPLPPSLMWTGKRRRSRSRSPSSAQQHHHHRQSLSPKERGMMRIVSRNQQKDRELEEHEPTLARSVAKRVAIENGQYVTVFVDTGNTSNDRSGKQKKKKQKRGKREKLTPSEELQFLIEEMKDTIEDYHEHHIHHPSRKMIPELEGKLLPIVSAVEQLMSTSSFAMSSSSVGGTNTLLSTRDIERQLTQVHSPLYDKIFGPPSEQHSSSIALSPTSSLVRANEKDTKEKEDDEEFEKEETLAWMLNEAGFVMDACSHLLSSSSSSSSTPLLEQENYYHQQILIRWKEYELQMYRYALQIYEKLYEGQDNQNFALAVSNVGTTLIELEEERMNYYQMNMMMQNQQEGAQERSPSLPTLEELVNTNPAFIEGIQLVRLSLSMNQNVYSFICEQLSGERIPSSSSNILLRTQEEQEEMNDISQEFASCLREAGQIFSRLGLIEDAVGVLRQQVEVLSACHEQNETRKRRLKLLTNTGEDENQDNGTKNSHMMVDLSWIAAALNELGFCLLEAKRIDEGLEYQLQALHIMRDQLQPNERDENNLAKLMNNCGFYLCESKKGRREGLPLLRESIELKRRLLFEEQLELLRRDPNSSKKQLLKKIAKDDPRKAMKNMANLRPSETFGVMLWNLGLQYEKMIADLMDEVNERLEREDRNFLSDLQDQQQEQDERKFILATVGDDDYHLDTNLNSTKIMVDCHEENEEEDDEVDKTSLVDCNSDDEEHQQRAETDLNHDRSILPEEFYHHEVQLVAQEQQQQNQNRNARNLHQIQHHYGSSPTSFVFTPEERKLYMNFVTLGLEAHSEALAMFQRVHQETKEENEDDDHANNSNPWIIKTRGKVGKMMVLESNLKKENFGLVTSHKSSNSVNTNLFKETPRRL